MPRLIHRFFLLTILLLTCGCNVQEQLPTRLIPADTPAPIATPTLLALAPTPAPIQTVTRAPTDPSPAEFPADSVPPSSATPTATATASTTPTATPCARPGRVEQGTFPSTIDGPERDVHIYYPPCYGIDGRVYPTLYILHGNIIGPSHWDNLGLDEAAEAAILAGEIPPLLIVMPDSLGIGDTTSGGPWSFEGVVLNELIPAIEAATCAWPSPAGRAIGGLSRGGYWALEIAFRHPDLFGSVGGHSAALLDQYAGPDINPQFTGLNNDLGDLRIYLDFGADDYLIDNTRRLHEDMVAAGVPHTWVLNSGAHEDSYWMAHLEEYLAWYAEPWPLERNDYPACLAMP